MGPLFKSTNVYISDMGSNTLKCIQIQIQILLRDSNTNTNTFKCKSI